ncbi:hypothetical protein [Variovorax sp. HW608]|nr:hypothetical protein [Variovorax sp. HW608]
MSFLVGGFAGLLWPERRVAGSTRDALVGLLGLFERCGGRPLGA